MKNNQTAPIDMTTLRVIERGLNKQRLSLLKSKLLYGKQTVITLLNFSEAQTKEEDSITIFCPEIGYHEFPAVEVGPGLFYSGELNTYNEARGSLFLFDEENPDNLPETGDDRIFVVPVFGKFNERIQRALDVVFDTYFDEETPHFHLHRR